MRAALRLVARASLLLLLTCVTPLPNHIARAWSVGGRPRPVDAIVVLGGGIRWPDELPAEALQRVRHGVCLYRANYARRLIVSGGVNPKAPAASEGKVMARIAREMGVPAADIVVEDRARRTLENGRFVAELMERHGWRSALIVTNSVHMRRAQRVFQRLGIEAHAAPSEWPLAPRVNTPAEGLAMYEATAYEVLATALYRARGWV